jgi:methionyl-tRNA formyltransferase
MTRIVFFGSSQFAIPSLRALTAAGYELSAVVSQPDRPRGRGLKLEPSAVTAEARAAGLPLLQPASCRAPEALESIARLRPGFLVVVAYGQILPQALLECAAHGAINLHASLLPAFRGAAPIAWALLRGERQTGVTTMLMEPGLDSGPILLQQAVEIGAEDDAVLLSRRLSELGAGLLIQTLDALLRGGLRARPQDHTRATFAPKLRADQAALDWTRSAQVLHDQIRALVPWPVACCWRQARRLKVWRARPAMGGGPPGTILALGAKALTVACGEGALDLLELQLEGRRRMPAVEAGRGLSLRVGETLADPGG